jgi:hypothetical protein
VNVLVPVVVGTPEITPVEAFSVSPAGNPPAVTAHVYGVLPPLAASVVLYGWFIVALASVDVVTLSDAPMVTLTGRLSVLPMPSVTWTVKLLVPAVVGVPAISQPRPSDSPAGNVPLARLHEYGATPPLTLQTPL